MQFVLTLLVALVTLSINAENNEERVIQCGKQLIRSGRIVGGEDAYDGEFPWLVSITLYGRHFCGGTIIGKRWILTAGHCVRRYGVSSYRVRVGEYRMTKAEIGHKPSTLHVERIILHPNYSNPRRYFNDIALLRLKTNITYSNYVTPICLPGLQDDYTAKEKGLIAGWGYLQEASKGGRPTDTLQKVTLPIYKYKECESWYREAGKNIVLQNSQMCAGYKDGGKDSCQGDSGGPLMTKENDRYIQIGIVSAGIGCAQPLLLGLYTRVESYLPWIQGYLDVS